MEEIRLWKSGPGKSVRSMEAVSQLDTEIEFEDRLVKNPELLEDGLRLVGRQTPTEGGWLDLLGVDRDGRLVIFELKKGEFGRDAVTQVLDYASAISAMDVETLAEHVQVRSGRGGVERIPDFRIWYEAKFSDLQRLFPVRMVLVGLGVDEKALRIARFLEDRGRQIEVITFHAFRDGETTLFARQMPIPPSVPGKPSQTTADRRERLKQWLDECGLRESFEAVRRAVREQMPSGVFEDPRTYGVSLQLSNRKKSGVKGPVHYFGIYVGSIERGDLVVSLGSVLEERHADDYKKLEVGVRKLGDRVRWINWHGGKAIAVERDEDWPVVEPLLCEFAAAVAKKWEQYRNTPPE